MSCEATNSIYIILTIAGMLLEFWLGKTEKTKSASIIELIINIILKLFKLKKKE